MRGLLFEGLVVSARRARRGPWVTAASLGLHTVTFALVVILPVLLTNDLPVTAFTPATRIYTFPTPPPQKVDTPPAARRDPAPRPQSRAPVAASIAVPVVVPDRVPVPDQAPLPDGPPLPFVLGAGCSDCPPENTGALPGEGAPGGEGAGTPLVRAGGDIEPPRKVRHVAPVYPPIAISARVTGLVIVECVIATDGRVTSARVLRGHPLLADAARAAVQQWTYVPTRLNGIPVAVEMTVTVNFTQPK